MTIAFGPADRRGNARAGSVDPDWPEGKVARLAALPFVAQLAKAALAKLEVVAETFQDLALLGVLLRADGAGDVVRPLAQLAVIEEEILAVFGLKPGQGLGIDAGPEEGVVADVPMDGPAGVANA